MKYIKILLVPSILYVVIVLILSFTVNPAFHWFLLATPFIFLISLIAVVLKYIWRKKDESSITDTSKDNLPDHTNSSSSKKWLLTVLALITILGISLYLFTPSRLFFIEKYQYSIEQEIPLEQIGVFFVERNCEDFIENKNHYTSCKMEEYRDEQIYTPTPIECNDMDRWSDNCRNLQEIQKAILSKNGNEKICTPMKKTREFPICIAQFRGTDVWKEGCEELKGVKMGDYWGIMVPYFYGKCLSKENADLTFLRDRLGSYSLASSGKREYNEILTPPWFTDKGRIPDERMFNYLEAIDANPNNTDELGRTAIILYIDYIRSIDTYMEKLPEKQRAIVIENQLKPLERLMQFGVDPSIKDLTGNNAFDYSKHIKDTELFKRTMEVMGEK